MVNILCSLFDSDITSFSLFCGLHIHGHSIVFLYFLFARMVVLCNCASCPFVRPSVCQSVSKLLGTQQVIPMLLAKFLLMNILVFLIGGLNFLRAYNAPVGGALVIYCVYISFSLLFCYQ